MRRNIIGHLSSSRVLFVALLALFVAFTGLSGCSKDAAINDPNNLGGGTVTTTIVGKIVDEAGQPVVGANVTAASLTAVTNKFGIFIIKNAKVSSSRCVVIAKKAGFFTAARAESPIVNGVTNMHLGMMANTTAFSVTASSGATLALGSGATVKFDPNSFVTSSGALYNGTVKVSARYLDPARTDFFDFFSGDNAGRQADNTEVGLKSVGVMRVELRDASGNALQLATGSKATLSVPKPASMASVPATMPLWYFDETIGEWKEDGSATLQAGKYVGTVSHFTDWNFDYKGETGELNARVVCNGIPIEGVVIHIFQRDITTGADGRIHIRRVPADQTLSLEILSAKNGGNYFINVPVAVNIVPGQLLDIGDITLDSPCPAAVSGTIMDCGDSKIEGLVFVSSLTGYSHYVYTGTGDFTMSAPPGVGLTIVATDPNGNESTPLDVLPLASGELRNVGIIKVCGTATNSFIDIVLGNTEGATATALSPDGSLLAVALYDGIKVFETKTGTVVSEPKVGGSLNTIFKLQFTVDNKKLMVLSPKIAITVFDITTATSTEVCTISNTSFYRYDAYIYDDGSKIITLNAIGAGFSLYSGTDGSLIKTLHPTNYVDSIGNFGFDRSEDAVVFLDKKTSNTFVVWSIANDALVRTISTGGISAYNAVYSEEAASFGFLKAAGTYSLYNTIAGTKISDITNTTQSNYRAGNFVVLTKDNIYADDVADSITLIKIIRIADGSTEFRKLLPPNIRVSNIVANRQQTHVAAVTNGFIRVWKFQ